MRKFVRLTALVLCAAMLLGLLGCTQDKPVETVPTTQPAPTEPPAVDIYTRAAAPVKEMSDLKLRISSMKTTTVSGETFEEKSEQRLNYVGLGTENMKMISEDVVSYDGFSITYDEIFADGVLYVSVEDEAYFTGTITAQECVDRYVPALLLDESLYALITAEETGSATTVTFSQPAGAESWAMPEGAEMVDASGSAFIDADGKLLKSTYEITYTYGPAEITQEVTCYITQETVEITVPENAEDFKPLEYVDAARLMEQGIGYMAQAKTLVSNNMESMFCQAAGLVRNISTAVNLHDRLGGNMSAKIGHGYFTMTAQGQEQYEMEEIFHNGKYTVSEDGGEPVEQSGVTAQAIEIYIGPLLNQGFASWRYWENAVAEDLGSVYYVECTYTGELGELVCDTICSTLWNDPDFLDNLSTAYETTEVTGYFAVDKYTGVVTASGYYYAGKHTIDGVEYELTLQVDKSVEAPALQVYKAITDEMPEETEPETKATPLFYHVTGEDGQEMWLLGTIHVGDSRTGYLPQEIYDAFDAADALALEYNANAFDEKMEEDEEFEEKISDYYFYSDGTTAKDHLDEELYEAALKYMKASGNYNMNTEYMKPSIWSNSIENFYLRQAMHYGLVSDKGVDNRLLARAEEQGKEILDVESGESQIAMMTGYSDDLQEKLLEDSISGNPMDYWDGVHELYEMWCAGDEAALRAELSDEVDTTEMTEEEKSEYEQFLPLIDEYNEAMSYDRNDGMLKVAIGYLESGKKVFYAVGLAHLLNNVNGLVDALREAGYTVELVTYQN